MSKDREAFALAIQAGEPVILWGAPGIAKTATSYAIAEALNRPIRTIMLSSKEPQDIAGLPIIDTENKTVHFAPPEWTQNLEDNHILFFDELSTAPPAVQAPALRIFQEKVVGDSFKLPKNVSLIAAANPADQAAGGWELSMPLANRLFHINWEFEPIEWAKGFITGFPKPVIPILPDNWKDHMFSTRSLIASFINKRPNLCLDIPKEDSRLGRAWASPRSWDMASRLLAASMAAGCDDEVNNLILTGCVGTGAAVEFMTWKKELNLPDPEDLLKNPSSIKMPKRSDIGFAIIASVISAVAYKNTKDRWENAAKVIGEAYKQAKDVSAQALHSLVQIPLPKGAKLPDELIPIWEIISIKK